MLLICLLVVGALWLGQPALARGAAGGGSDSLTTFSANYYDANATSAHLFRFRDFVPRSVQAYDTAAGRNAGGRRAARGFQFHVDNEDIVVDLEFTIPLVGIPVARSMALTRTTLRNLVNLNTGSLLLSGLLVAVGALVFALFKTLNTPIVYTYDLQGKKRTRAHEEEEAATPLFAGDFPNAMHLNELVGTLEGKLQRHNIDATACLQRSICGYVRHLAATADMRGGGANNWPQILHGVLNLEPLQRFMSGSALASAIAAGRATSDNCDALPGSCQWLTPANRWLKMFLDYLT